MRRSRRGPALFELLEHHEDGQSVSRPPNRWWKRSRRSDEPPLPAAKVRSSAELSADSGGTPGPPSSTAMRTAISDPFPDVAAVCERRLSQESDEWLSLDGDRVRLRLTSLGAAGALFIVALGIIIAFGMGSRRGETKGFQRGLASANVDDAASAADEIQAVKSQKPATYLISDLVAGDDRPADASERDRNRTAGAKGPTPSVAADGAGRTKWLRDHTYIVAQEMPASNRVQADAAQEYLRKNGIATEIVKPNDRSLFLITTQGFQHKDPAQKKQSEQILDKIRSLGVQYYSSGGGYKLEGYFKTLKQDNW